MAEQVSDNVARFPGKSLDDQLVERERRKVAGLLKELREGCPSVDIETLLDYAEQLNEYLVGVCEDMSEINRKFIELSELTSAINMTLLSIRDGTNKHIRKA